MILERKKIEINNKVYFETIVSNTNNTIHFQQEDSAYFIYVKHGHHIAISPNDIIEVKEGNLGISVGKSLILKTYPNKVNQLYEVLIIYINRDIVTNILGSTITNRSKNLDFTNYMFTGKPCVVSQNYVDGVLLYFNNRHVVTTEIAELKVKEILLLLLTSKKADEIKHLISHFIDNRKANFKEIIETHILSDLSIEEISQLCNMSLSTFKRQFKKIFDCTPNQYLIEKRLEYSKKLLQINKNTIDEIAHLSGFKTTSHFSRKFKEKFNSPPSQYKLTLSDK